MLTHRGRGFLAVWLTIVCKLKSLTGFSTGKPVLELLLLLLIGEIGVSTPYQSTGLPSYPHVSAIWEGDGDFDGAFALATRSAM
jgi:hypothetical protein